MIKKLTSFIMACMLAFATLGMFACGGSSSNSDALTIMYYPGGYGKDWLEEFVIEFIAEEKYEGDITKVSSSDYDLREGLDSDVDSDIGSKSKCPDLIIQESLPTEYIMNDLVLDLTDVYNEQVGTSNGPKTIADYVLPESKMMFTMSPSLIGKTDIGTWAIPMTAKPLSIAYNETLLNKIQHTTAGNAGDCVDNGYWTKAPTTFEELMTCFADINAQRTVDGKEVFAFGATFKGSGTLWFEPLIYTWWAQYQGLEDAKTGLEAQGSFYDFFNWDSAEKYRQEGISKALEHIKEMVYGGTRTGKTDGYPNFYQNPGSVSLKEFQNAFAQGKIVFCLTGDFFAKENKTLLEQNKTKVSAKLMPVPAYDAEHAENAENYTFLNTTSCMYVPAKGKHTKLAKKFLKFINDEDHLVRFTELTGGIRPFGTNEETAKNALEARYRTVIDATAEEWGKDFAQSVFDLYFGCDEVILTFPKTYKKWGADKEPSVVYMAKDARRLPPAGSSYATLFSYLKNNTVEQVVITNSGSTPSLYNSAKTFYSDFANEGYARYMNTALYSLD